MSSNALVNRMMVVAGGVLFLCASARPSLGQSRPSGSAPLPRATSQAQPYPGPPDILSGLTLSGDQKGKINQIREDVKARLAAVAQDKKLSPEVTDAMVQGYRRIENSEIFSVLTPDQQREVRKRMSDWKAAAHQRQQPLQRSSVPGKTLPPK